MTSLALSFNDVKLNPVTQGNQVWLKSSEISEALGYKQADAVTKIYNRNSDEFTKNMTQVIENPQTPNLGVRVFSLRGCHLLAMFSRTGVAKEFRKWVLDVLDREVGQHTTVQDREPLNKAIVMLVAASGRLNYSDAYKLVHQRFGVEHTHELAPLQLNEAVEYVHRLISGKSANPYFENQAHNTALHMLWVSMWWRCYGDSLKMLNPNMALKINDHFGDGALSASLVLGEKAKLLSDRIQQDLPFNLGFHDRAAFFRRKYS